MFAVIDAFMSEIPDYNPGSPSGSHFSAFLGPPLSRDCHEQCAQLK